MSENQNRGPLSRAAVRAYAAGHRNSFESLLKEFVETPSISMDPGHKPDIQKMGELGVRTLKEFGFDARLIPTKGNPIIYGEDIVDPAAPTVMVYNHMDVQPGGDPAEWKTEPFKFTQQGDTYYGRGTTDDKGPGLTALFAARWARERGARVNIKFLWELEEEIGSPSFAAGIKPVAKDIAADVVVVSDTIWISRDRPAAPAGLRGLQAITLSLETGATDQHSGVTGGAARNPITELAQLIGEMVDGRTGKVRIPGFYKEVVSPTKAELENFRQCGFSIAKFKKDHQFKSLRTDDPLEVMKRIWAMPTFEVHGIVGGYTGPGIKTVVPPRAQAKISMRLVPDMNPRNVVALVRDFVKQKNPDVKVSAESPLGPYRGLTTGPLADLIKASMKFAFGKEPVFVREGGSIGAVLTMEQTLKAPVLFLGLSLPEHGYHAPNENYDWAQTAGGMAAFEHLFETAAELDKKTIRSGARK